MFFRSDKFSSVGEICIPFFMGGDEERGELFLVWSLLCFGAFFWNEESVEDIFPF